MAVAFSRRQNGYKIGLTLLYSGLSFYIMGFCSPYWYKLRNAVLNVHGGLWQTCMRVLAWRVCSSITKVGAMDWMSTVQGLQCVGLLGLIGACLYSGFINWIQRNPTHTRLLEALGIICSMMGLAGCGVFIAQTEKSPDDLVKQLSRTSVSYGYGKVRHSVAWAFGISCAASLLCLFASILLAIFNSPIPDDVPTEVIGYTDPVTGVIYPVIDPANQARIDAPNQAVYYIPPRANDSGFQPVASGFQPPPYEVVMASAPPFAPRGAK